MVFAGWFASRRARARLTAVCSSIAALTLVLGSGLAYGAMPEQAGSSTVTANPGYAVTGMTPVKAQHVAVSTATDHSFVPQAAKSTWPAAASATLALQAPAATRAAQAGAKVQAVEREANDGPPDKPPRGAA